MMRRSGDSRRRSSTLAPQRVSDSAVKSAVKPSRPSAAAAGSSVKSRLPRPSLAASARAGAGAASAGPRAAHRSVTGPAARSRLTVGGPRISSVTPQTARRPSAGPSAGRPSTASKAGPSRLSVDSQRRLSRGSGIGASRQRCADPRPISDKAYWQPATQRVVQFLADRGYNENRPPVTYKDLMKCTGRLFDDIFSFVYSMFYPDFTMAQKKREEAVPAIMKLLNYPGQITKSHLITVGCAHSWPSLVAVLDWLCGQVDLSLGPEGEEANPLMLMLPTVDNEGFPEVDRQSVVLLQHSLETYSRWLANQERPDDEEARALTGALAELQTTDEGELRRLKEENERLGQEASDLAADLGRLEATAAGLARRRAEVETESRRLAEREATKREQQAAREAQRDRLEAEVQEQARLRQLKQEQLESLRQEIGAQELSADDVSRIAQERAQLQQRIDGVKEEIQQLQTENGALEMDLARAQSQRQAAARRLNAATAPLSAGDQVQLRLTGSEGEQLGQLAECERAFDGAERAARHQLERLESTLLQQERNARDVRGELEQARQEHFHVTSRLRRLEEEEAGDNRQLQQQHATLDGKRDEIEKQLTQVSQELQQLDVASQRSRLEAEIEQQRQKNAERQKQMKERQQEVAENAALALEFRRWMEEDNGQLVKQVVALCTEADEKLERTLARHRQLRDELEAGEPPADRANRGATQRQEEAPEEAPQEKGKEDGNGDE